MTDTLAGNGYRLQPGLRCCYNCQHVFYTQDAIETRCELARRRVGHTSICDRYEPTSQDAPASGGRCPECGSAVRVRGCRWCGKTWIGLRDSRRLYCSKACGDAAREQKKQKQQH